MNFKSALTYVAIIVASILVAKLAEPMVNKLLGR